MAATGVQHFLSGVDLLTAMTGLTQHTINTPYIVGPVHCYSGRLADELVLFDTGPSTSEGERYLRTQVDLKNLRHIFVTHCHIDHYGQCAWLEKNSDATIYLPYRDCLKITQHDQRLVGMYQLLANLGFDRQWLDGLQRIFDSDALFPPLPKKFRVAETDIPQRLGIEVVNCPGHCQSDLVYVGDNWAVTGDTMLRGVFQSPLLDVDLTTGERFNNYAAYCASLVKLGGLRGRQILPGHRRTVGSIDQALLFYVSKLLLRVEQLRPHQDETNVMVLLDKLLEGRTQDVFHLYLKASEVVFMKDLLQEPEKLRASLEKIGLFDQVKELFSAATGC
jgi:hydroxyacylglutathione hydrolase